MSDRKHQGVDALTRGADYRADGWSRFDVGAAPYTADEVVRERQRYGESRPSCDGDAVRDCRLGTLTRECSGRQTVLRPAR